MSTENVFKCECCHVELLQSQIDAMFWKQRPSRIRANVPPDGVNHGVFDMHVCSACRQKLYIAFSEAIEILRCESAEEKYEAKYGRAIHVVVTDRDDREPSNNCGPIVCEQYCNGATLAKVKVRAAEMCKSYGEARVARLTFVGKPFVRKTEE